MIGAVRTVIGGRYGGETMIIDPLWIETANAHSLSKVFRPRMSTSFLVSDALCTEIAQPTPPQPTEPEIVRDETATSAGRKKDS